MARKRDRMFAAFGASLFLITSSALTIIVIYTLVQQSHDKGTTSKVSSSAIVNAILTTQTGDKMQNFTPTSTPQAKLEAQDIEVGTGATVKSGDTITADYVGALMSDGTVFDASASHGGPATFPLSGVIQGWSLGIPGMKVGGTRRLLIPSALGYGANGTSGIPANSDLVFDVTLVKIN